MNKLEIEREFLLSEARLSTPPSEALVKYHDMPALAREKRQFREFNDVDLAHTVMLSEQAILPHEVAKVILKGLLELRDIGQEKFSTDPLKGSFLLQVESFLFSRMGEDIGGQMHTGRSRIDQGATVRRLYKRNRLLLVLSRLNEFRAALIDKAQDHVHTVMPGYTHMQQAQPWVFGHYLLSIVSRLNDDYDRLIEVYGRVNLNPLGAVGLSGTAWPLDRNRTTELLGFNAVLENSKLGREAFYAAEAIGALSFVMATLNDLATDLHIWSSTEFGFVESADAYCGTSSIFPQKKNPAGLETVKKAAGGAVTWLATALATFRAEGTGDQAVRDLPLIDDAFQTVESMLDLFAGIVTTLIVHENRMRAALAGSWCTASNLADVIVRETGLSFRQVHHAVARLVRICLDEGIMPADVNSDILDRAAQETLGRKLLLDKTLLKEALDPEVFVTTRQTVGSVSPGEIERMISTAEAKLAEGRDWLVIEQRRILNAEEKLKAAAHAIVGS
ncbi:argininosuccinate lyase [Agrobacterium tumefaciens]|uniref:argininosuccinate lyase n=1 Tax=Agrobacterium tumefaciens TaxID=358 RepID=UPI0022436FE9|nr:argininosuccinate lyase [Agrobacterium tumefaciens]MCW8060084.1 argininosuccinate lyase [Agrobacterium tumefaciens]MCW8142799.1 argininosuccinate lyase [Agrobacterium tumefaciens]